MSSERSSPGLHRLLARSTVITAQDLARLDALRDEDIDYSDCPELDDAFFAQAHMPASAPQPIPVKGEQEAVAPNKTPS